jgi:glycosyltransferase involved in cell wall biosynthesis/peptidoglycan/xylan/chitin deacetylase (PgdA/CDA1 family)
MDTIALSVIIPTYNRVELLRTCLEALSRQTQPAETFEVLVIVDGSTDGTMEMLEDLETPFPLRPVRQENSGQAAALNRGIDEASGRYCLFLDDDIVAAPELIGEHLRAQQSREKTVAAGQITVELSEHADWYAHAFAEGWRQHYQDLNSGASSLTWEGCYSGNLSAPRGLLVSLQGFSTQLSRGFDVELGYRLCQAGCHLQYLSAAVGCQMENKRFPELSRDAERAGAAESWMYQRDPAMLSQSLGSFAAASWRKLLLQRLLLGLRVPPRLLAALGPFLRTPLRRYSWHGFIQNLCYWRGVRRTVREQDVWKRLTAGTPILLYHAIGTRGEPAGAFVMPARRFASHMNWIRRLGYTPLSLADFLACRRTRTFPPARSVVITLDDGYEDNFANAFPILKEHNIPASIFLVSRYVDQANHWDTAGELAHRPLMNWRQIKEMDAQGIRFGAHTRTHADLTAVTPSEAEIEIAISRNEIERELGRPVETFAYPFGRHDPAVQEMVVISGYAAGCTVDAGLNTPTTPSQALRRSEIQGTDTLIRLAFALWFGDAEAVFRRKR